MSYYVKRGNTFSVSSDNALDIHSKLPANNYIIKHNKNTDEFFLELTEEFKPISKFYGDTVKNADRIINTYLDRTVNTGVMLTGEKGSGKTLLAKTISTKCNALDIPTIIINQPYVGDAFMKFIQDIDQPCVILFDEFEKVYIDDTQEFVLTLLDGIINGRKLFVFTCNNKYKVDSNMKNRPGRIYYMLEFAGLDKDFILEYCNDNLINKEYTDKVSVVASIFSSFNFDMLKALIEEMNRYNESPQEALRLLNTKPEFDDSGLYTVDISVNGIAAIKVSPAQWDTNPLKMDDRSFGYALPTDTDKVPKESNDDYDDYGDRWSNIRLSGSEVSHVNASNGIFIFNRPNNVVVTFTRKSLVPLNYHHLAV